MRKYFSRFVFDIGEAFGILKTFRASIETADLILMLQILRSNQKSMRPVCATVHRTDSVLTYDFLTFL